MAGAGGERAAPRSAGGQISIRPGQGRRFRRAGSRHGATAARFARARAIEQLLQARRLGRGRSRALARRRLHPRLRAADARRRRRRDPDDLAAAAARPRLRFGKTYPEIARLSLDIRAFLAMADGLRAPGFSTPPIFADASPTGSR